MALHFSETHTEWVKFGKIRNIAFVGRETICVGDGCHMVFYNLNTKSEKIYTAGDAKRGMGVACLAGHRTYSMFAFAEKAPTASIFVFSCPDFIKVTKLSDGTKDGYIALAFSEAEYLFALSGIPSFEISVWNWRTGEFITKHASDISDKKQLLKCNYNSPVYLGQLAVGTNKLTVWEVLQCGKRCIATPHPITTHVLKQAFMSLQWTSEGGLFLVDKLGDVYTVTIEYKVDLVIKCGHTGDSPTYLSWFKAGLAVACPNGTIMHFKKSGNWNCDWQVTPNYKLVRLLNSPRDFLVGVTVRGDILLFNSQTQEFISLREHENYFQDICMIYPTGEQFIALSWHTTVSAWQVSTGTLLDAVQFSTKTLAIASNPEYPYFAVGFDDGKVKLFSLHDGKTISLLTTFVLTRNSISNVSFAEAGKLLIAVDMEVGEFFVIEGLPSTKMRVVATCCAHRQVADYILVGSKTCLRLFVLNVTSEVFLAGNTITRYCIIKDKECPDKKDYIFERENTLYTKIYATEKPNRDRVFYAMPMKAKCLHELEVRRGDDYARLVGKVPNKHQMRKVLHHFDHHHVLTYGYDGLIAVHTRDFVQKYMIMPHHRADGGVAKAYVGPLCKYIISLGRNNVLTCNSLTAVVIDEEKRQSLREVLSSPKIVLMFKYPTIGFLLKGKLKEVTWLEMEQMKKTQEEYMKCEEQRKSILKRLRIIKRQVEMLLTRNLEGPPNEYLDIQDFNLDTELKERLWLDNSIKCKHTKIYLEKLIIAQDKVSQWIKQFCWDTMAQPGKTMYGIFSNIEVENYTLLPEDSQQLEIVRYIEEHRSLELMMSTKEIFEPWIPRTPSELKLFMDIKPSFCQIAPDKQYLEDYITDDESSSQIKVDQYPDSETMTAFAGSITHTFVPLNKGHYTQHQIQTFLQTEYESILSKVENIKLRQYLNKEFEFLMSLKVRQITELMEKNARLKHILSELNYFSVDEDKMNIVIYDPEWKQQERPQQILEVKDNEIAVTPYISPSQQAILDAEAAERERIRLLLLADDFKERALMAMMNGVLEIRWEDELRKDVPVPKCVEQKEPEDYNQEDLRAIRDYEEKVKFLESERLRYKRMLVAEYGSLGNSVRESVKKFNGRVEDLLLLKIKVDSAIGQENLKINRFRLRNFKRIQMNKAEREILKSISAAEKSADDLQKLIMSLYDNQSECRNFVEVMQIKEKVVEKAFRRDMQEASPTAQEIAFRLYRRRPKTNVRNITSVSILLELSKCVVSKERTVILNQDALDFLKALDNLDLYVGVPNAVDETLYATICKHRRSKIDSEIKIKAAQLEVTEADNTLSYLHRVLAIKKDLLHKLNNDLAQLRSDKIKEAQDIELQLVLKQGFVEVPMSGEITDFEQALMLSRKDIEDINHVILDAGNKKLKAMRDTMNFRRGILAMEWEHMKMKMEIEDLEDHLNDIRAIKVTKEIQSYMKAKARGESPDKGLTFEQEVELVRQSYQKLIDMKKGDCADLQEKIDAVKDNSRSLDKQIINLNVDVCECKLNVDEEVIRKEKELIDARMSTLIKRSKLVKQIQANHNEILMMQTELELLRLKTYPTLKYKINE